MQTYGPNAALNAIKPQEANPTSKPIGEMNASSQNFGDMVMNLASQSLDKIESAGKAAEGATVAAANNQISELEHVMKLNEFTDSLSLGTKTIEKMTEAFRDVNRMLG